MEMEYTDRETITSLPRDPRNASKVLLDKILHDIHPLVLKIRSKSNSLSVEESTSNIRDVYTLCLSQIQKCVLSLFEVFKLEYNNNIFLQETRQCNLERLSWCVNRLISIDNYLERISINNSQENESGNDSFNVTVMYFVNWIDHAFHMLAKLSEAVYRTDYKENEELFEPWRSHMVECVSELHLSIDELLLSAMTLCRYCLPTDQLVIKTRCQVVLRETKSLLSELIEGDLNTVDSEALKLPVMPTNINVMIDVLKDVLYALETNTNTALLALLVHWFSCGKSPVDVLKQHFLDGEKGRCSCLQKSTDDVAEDCQFVKDFDLYNERLLQIGYFAVSCSSDQHRILALRSGLASLEALDPYLVPALMSSPDSCHSVMLIKSWLQEVAEIRDNVFLIVDLAAFTNKSKQMLHQKLVDTLKETTYNNSDVCAVINIACVLEDFFNVYTLLDPLASIHRDELRPLLADLSKVILECKVVSNLLCTGNDFAYDVKTPSHKEATLDKLYKRLKVLHTLVSKINTLLQPKDQLFEDEVPIQNVTRTIPKYETYVNSPKVANLTRSIFARTYIRSSTRNFPLSKLTKHLRAKNCSQLNFSVELDRLFHVSSENGSEIGIFRNKALDRVRERSGLHNFSPIKNRSSMRKIVLDRQLAASDKAEAYVASTVEMQSLMDENESLQLTEVLNQINDTTHILTAARGSNLNQTHTKAPGDTNNVLRIKVNHNMNAQNVCYISVNCSGDSRDTNDTIMTSNLANVTQPSNVTTMERINDLELVQTKLDSLKSQFETSM